MKKFLSILIVLLLSGVVVTAQDDDFRFGDALPTAPELAARGDYAVGVRTMSVTNPDQFDLLNLSEENPTATYDRTLTLEVWYPASLEDGEAELVVYDDNLGRADADNLRPFTFEGRAARDAAPNLDEGPFPLVIVSHGYPGSRLMMSNLTENLASKGYIVVAIGHQESTFTDVSEFGITLLYRAIDQLFVLDEMSRMSVDDSFFAGLVDADNTAIIGYSMGGYGALNSIGAGYNATLEGFLGPVVASRLASNEAYADSIDDRVKAAVLFAPWGGDLGVFGIPGGLWDDEALGGITIPTLWAVGSEDDVSQYSAVVNLFENAINSDRYLLTYDNALHNVVPNPPPAEATALGDYERYADPSWNTAHINNVNQHFVTAFLNMTLKGDDTSAYLDVAVENANDAVYAVDGEGNFTEDHTYWTGFSPRTALGLSFRHETP
ncbi:MAG: hypothetical protein WBC91_06660 [Phototrophicaceae bacterium]